MTIWHTEVPPSLQHMGIGGKLVEEAVQLASRDSSRLRIVCPFAKEHLARHPELKQCYAVADQALIADNESLSGGQTMAGASLIYRERRSPHRGAEAKTLIDPFLSDNLSRDNGRSGYLTGKNSTQGGDL